MRRLHLGFIAWVLATVPATVGAQEYVQVQGKVVDEQTGERIPNVDIVVRSPDERYLRSVVADDSGRFELTVRRVPGIRLYASRVGYRDNITPLLYFDDHEYFEVEVRLDPEAVLLAPLEVVARSSTRSPILSSFDHRVRNGLGHYITRRDIDAANPMLVTDLLAAVPGVRLAGSGSGTRRSVSMSRSTGPNCPVQVFVDGLLMTQRLGGLVGDSRIEGLVIDDLVMPGSVEGIEVYRGLSTVPAEFLTPEAKCGVIAIWTRRGG